MAVDSLRMVWEEGVVMERMGTVSSSRGVSPSSFLLVESMAAKLTWVVEKGRFL